MYGSFLILLFVHFGIAAPVLQYNLKYRYQDGTEIFINTFGDEFLCYTETIDGYTIQLGPGYKYYYCNIKDGKLQRTDKVVGKDDYFKLKISKKLRHPNEEEIINLNQNLLKNSRPR